MRSRAGAIAGRREARVAAAIIVVALGLRVATVAGTWDYMPLLDPADYHRHGASIARGDGYPDTLSSEASERGPTAFRPPLYPYFLGAIYAVTGPKWNPARLVQAVVGTIAVALIGLVAFQLFGPTIGLISMALAAVYPPLILSGAALVSEALFLPFELGAIAATLQHRRSRHGYRWAILAGALAGIGTLTRPNGFVLVPALAAGVWALRPRLSGRALAQPAVLVAAATLMVVPWTIRNAIVMDAFVPVTTQAGFTLGGTYNEYAARNEKYPGAWIPPNFAPRFRYIFRPGSGYSEVETERELRARALDYIGEHPSYIAKVAFWNSARMLELTGFEWGELVARDVGIDRGLADVGIVSFWIVGLLAVAGAGTAAARRVPGFLWLALALLVVSVVLISGTTRYRTPVEPFVILLAALALDAGWRRLRTRGQGRTAAKAE